VELVHRSFRQAAQEHVRHSFRPEAAPQALDLGNSLLEQPRGHSLVERQAEAVGKETGRGSGRRSNLPGRANRPARVLDRRNHLPSIGARKARAHLEESTAAGAPSRSVIVVQRAEAAVAVGVAVVEGVEEEGGDEKLEP
jgi:hypothetical protein